MDLHNLEYMIAMAEEEGISRAAQKLYISQPGLSKALSVLEKKLGVQIFERRRDKLTPTVAGQIYIDAARKMLAIRNEVNENIYQIAKNTVYPQFSIGMNNSATIAELMMLMVEQLQTEMPVFFDVDSVECTKMLLEGKLNIASLSFPDGLPDELECILEEPDEIVVVVPNTPEFDYINRTYTDTIPLIELSGSNAVQCRPDSGLGITIDRYLKENDVAFNYTCSISVLSAVMLAVESGAGLTLMHKSIATKSQMYSIYQPLPALEYVHYLCVRKGVEQTSKAKRIIKLLWGLEI